MKSITQNLRLLIIILLMASCSPMIVQMSILKINNKYLLIRNGEREVYWGFTGESNMTDQNAVILVPINYNDSIFVEVRDSNKILLNRSFKLPRGKFLYIDNLNGDFSIYSQNKEKPLY